MSCMFQRQLISIFRVVSVIQHVDLRLWVSNDHLHVYSAPGHSANTCDQLLVRADVC